MFLQRTPYLLRKNFIFFSFLKKYCPSENGGMGAEREERGFLLTAALSAAKRCDAV